MIQYINKKFTVFADPIWSPLHMSMNIFLRNYFIESMQSPCGVHVQSSSGKKKNAIHGVHVELWTPCRVHENSMGQGKVHMAQTKEFISSPSLDGIRLLIHPTSVFSLHIIVI